MDEIRKSIEIRRLEQQENIQESFEKGISLPIGTIKERPNGNFIKTAQGWKYHSKKGSSTAKVEAPSEAKSNRPYKDMSKEDLHKLADKKAGRDRMDAINELALRYEEKTGRPAQNMGALDRDDPKVDPSRRRLTTARSQKKTLNIAPHFQVPNQSKHFEQKLVEFANEVWPGRGGEIKVDGRDDDFMVLAISDKEYVQYSRKQSGNHMIAGRVNGKDFNSGHEPAGFPKGKYTANIGITDSGPSGMTTSAIQSMYEMFKKHGPK